MTQSHDETVKQEFAKQAKEFGKAGLTLSSAAILGWIVETLDPRPGWRVLDVAAGTGLLGRALAPRVAHVTAIDLTPEMLAQGRQAAAADGLSSLTFIEGSAESLPFDDGGFDLVAARLAVHHFAEPPGPVAEMARVCRPGGRVALIDLVAPADPGLAASYNRLERLRDPSHVRALAPDELTHLLAAAGLAAGPAERREVEVEVGPWAALTRTPAAALNAIEAELDGELKGGAATGMRPFRRDSRLFFRQTWQISMAAKAMN